jgi:hypothetical protein
MEAMGSWVLSHGFFSSSCEERGETNCIIEVWHWLPHCCHAMLLARYRKLLQL